MKQLKKILGLFMAIVMMMSTLGVVAQARRDYTDTYLNTFDDVDQPVITANQAYTMVCDAVDALLKDADIYEDIAVIGVINLRSLNEAYSSIYGIYDSAIWTIAKPLIGGLSALNCDALKNPRRTTNQSDTDKDVLYGLFAFLDKNRGLVGDLVKGTLSMGIVSNFFTLDLNLNLMLKEMLFEATYGKNTPYVNKTVDVMVQDLLKNLVVGEWDPVKEEYDGFAPELADHINISAGNTYDFVETLLQQAYNILVTPLVNEDLRKVVRKACGVVYDKTIPNDPGDASPENLNEYAEILDIDFPAYTGFTVPAGSTFFKELNNILAGVVNLIVKVDIDAGWDGWQTGTNAVLKTNLIKAAKYTLNNTDFFPSYVETKTPAQVNAMTDQQLIAYIVRLILNTTTYYIHIPETAETLIDVGWYALKELNATALPHIDYSTQPKTRDGVLSMATDLLAHTINQSMDMNPAAGTKPGEGLIPYGLGTDATLLMITNWAINNYGGLLNINFGKTSAWADLDKILAIIVPPAGNWLPASVNGDSRKLVYGLLDDILSLNLDGILALIDRVPGSELYSRSFKQVLIDVVTRLINSLFPAVFGSYTTLDSIVTNSELGEIVKRLLNQLWLRRDSILPDLAPLLAMVLDLSGPQAYKDPEINLPNSIGGASTLTITNDSKGINTYARDKNGAGTKDKLYQIKIVSVTSSIPAITVGSVPTHGINGGDSVNIALNGTFTAGQSLMITVSYDILMEDGSKLTTAPLTQRAYSCISQTGDDANNWVKVESGNNNLHFVRYAHSYFNFPAPPQEPTAPGINATPEEVAAFQAAIAQYPLDLAAYGPVRDAAMQQLKSAYIRIERKEGGSSGNRDTSIGISSHSVDSRLRANGVTWSDAPSIQTNGDGGAWNVPYYKVSENATQVPDGEYKSTFTWHGGKTQSTLNQTYDKTTPHNLVIYSDYGLPSLLRRAIEANREPENYEGYVDAEHPGTLYVEYTEAIKEAVGVVYRPRQTSTFMSTHAPKYRPAVARLEAAIEALEATEISAGVETLKTRMESFAPSNEYEDPLNPGMMLYYDYDHPNHNYFGGDDYVGYTYGRYRKNRNAADGLYWSQQLPKAPVLRTTPPPTAEEIEAHNTAYAQWQIDYAAAREARRPVGNVQVSYADSRLELYGGRLIRTSTYTARLTEAFNFVTANKPLKHGCSAEQWEKFERAYNFANLVKDDTSTDLRQSKVNTARNMLWEAWKQTPQIFVEAIDESFDVDYENFFITGFDISASALDVLVQSTRGGSLEFVDTPKGRGTGTQVNLLGDGDLIRSYTAVICGDIDGDGNAAALDALMALKNSSGMGALEDHQAVAADVNKDGTIGSADALSILKYSAGNSTTF